MKTKKKICWNCEGNVALDNDICPYCGVHVNISHIGGGPPNKNTQIASPFKTLSINSSEKSIPKAPYALPVQEVPVENPISIESSKTAEEEPFSDVLKQSLLALLALLLGCVFVIFGLILFFFSNSEGMLILSWNGNYGFIYAILGLPLLYLGWHTLSKIGD